MHVPYLLILVILIKIISKSSNQHIFSRIKSLDKVLTEVIIRSLIPIRQNSDDLECHHSLDKVSEKPVSKDCALSLIKSRDYRMLDATGHFPPDSLASGNFFAIGSYDACLNLNNRNSKGTGTTYCTAIIDISPFLFGKNYSAQLNLYKEDFPLPPTIPGINYFQGWCLPDSCGPDDVLSITQIAISMIKNCYSHTLREVMGNTNRSEMDRMYDSVLVDEVVCNYIQKGKYFSLGINRYHHYKAKHARINLVQAKRIKSSDIIRIYTYFGFFIILALVGFAGDYGFLDFAFHKYAATIKTYNIKYSSLKIILDCLSPTQNFAKIMGDCHSKPCSHASANHLNDRRSRSKLDIFYGIRVLAVIYTMRGHAFGFGLHYVRNVADTSGSTLQVQDPLTSLLSFLYYGFLTVDTFLFVSGFLAAATAPEDLKHGCSFFKPWLKYVVKRIFRLTPLYATLIVFIIYLSPYMGSGPFWPAANNGGLNPPCLTHWWTNLLYVNNVVGCDKMCAPWTWYLACDLQYHLILVPIFVRAFARASDIDRARAPLIATLAIGVCCNFLISYMNDFNSLDIKDGSIMPSFFYKFYIKPHVRAAPFLLGLLLGCEHFIPKKSSTSYVLSTSKCPDANSQNKHKKHYYPGLVPALICLGFILLQGFNWSALLIQILTRLSPRGHVPSALLKLLGSIVTALYRPGWSLVIYLFLDRILKGDPNFVVIGSFLSSVIWVPLGNLTYATYLIHPLLMQIIYRQIRTPIYSTTLASYLYFITFSISTYALAFLPTLIIETPLRSLAKIFLCHKCLRKTNEL